MKLTNEQLDALANGWRLSPRETELIDLLFQGHTSNEQLAAAMGLALGTAKTVVHNVLAKSYSRDKADLFVRCLDIISRVR